MKTHFQRAKKKCLEPSKYLSHLISHWHALGLGRKNKGGPGYCAHAPTCGPWWSRLGGASPAFGFHPQLPLHFSGLSGSRVVG